jgi:hypothetical protein
MLHQDPFDRIRIAQTTLTAWPPITWMGRTQASGSDTLVSTLKSREFTLRFWSASTQRNQLTRVICGKTRFVTSTPETFMSNIYVILPTSRAPISA